VPSNDILQLESGGGSGKRILVSEICFDLIESLTGTTFGLVKIDKSHMK